jgi:hypothetical protein
MTIMLSGSDLTVMAVARPGQAVALASAGRAGQLTRELAGFTRSDDTLPADLEPLAELMTRGGMAAAGRG